MKKALIPVLLVVLVFAGLFWWYRGHKNAQSQELIEQLQKPLLYNLAQAEYKVETYTGASSELWLDRSYTTEQDVAELKGLSFVRVARDSRAQLVVVVTEPCIIYTLGNSEVPNNYADWEATDIAVRVHDSFEPRAMNTVYRKEFSKGEFVLNFLHSNPAVPIFFPEGKVVIK